MDGEGNIYVTCGDSYGVEAVLLKYRLNGSQFAEALLPGWGSGQIVAGTAGDVYVSSRGSGAELDGRAGNGGPEQRRTAGRQRDRVLSVDQALTKQLFRGAHAPTLFRQAPSPTGVKLKFNLFASLTTNV